MSKAIENLEAAQRKAMAMRPKVGGFPYLAETLRQVRCHAQHLELAIGSKPVPHVRRIGGYAGHTSGIPDRGRAAI